MQRALELRIIQLMQALQNQWQQGYEAALLDLEVDIETHIQSTSIVTGKQIGRAHV